MPVELPYPALHATHGGIWIASARGETSAIGRGDAMGRVTDTPTIMLNAPLIAARLGLSEISGLDLLELFAFVHPARFCVPTPAGLARALGLEPPADEGAAAAFLRQAAACLLDRLQAPDWPEREGAWSAGQALFRLGWPWAPVVIEQLKRPEKAERWLFSRLPEWEDSGGRPPARSIVLDEDQIAADLARLTGEDAEPREGQRRYAQAAARVFAPRAVENQPNMLLAEAGTGIGKTLGYLAPASRWAGEAAGTVWISTYTKALHRQLDRETARVWPDTTERDRKVVIRKGRENYLCLLNLEDAIQGGFAGRAAILAQLVARWAAYTRDGDMIGGDLPGWLPSLFRRAGSIALTDRRGECVYAGCPHYRKCFIERSMRAARDADLVIANHALVMILAQRGSDDGNGLSRLIFDEGHHLFDAADATFAAALTGQELIELRRWILGPEKKARGRRRGLAARLSDVASYDEAGEQAILDAAKAAEELPGEGWLGRIAEGLSLNATERLLSGVRATVYARATAQDAGFGLETDAAELDGALIAAAAPALETLESLLRPLVRLGQRLEGVMEDAPDWLDGQARARVEGAIAGLGLRCRTLQGLIALLARLGGPADPDFIDWLAVDRVEGREYDVGIHRRWLDPTVPLAETVLKQAQGVVVTSATLRAAEGWEAADARTGAAHLDRPATHFAVPSPFDYGRQADVLIVTDIRKGDIAALAGGYARLIEAAQGGALGLFSAIHRLRAVHARIADRLAHEGLPLYAQHVDPLDTGTLIDIFRDDPHASLLGTDALRDGVDVPGHSLRLVIMEGVPWPRPTVLHAARRAAGGGAAHDDAIIRARLAQGFGRLIRRASDHGHFVILSPALPSRLLNAFPVGVPIRRVTLAEAAAIVRSGDKSEAENEFASDSRLSSVTPLRHQGPD